MGRLFGTDGVRGRADSGLTAELCFHLGRAAAAVLPGRRGRPRVLVGRDTRLSGSMLEAAFCAGVCAMGADVLTVGVLPTPALAFLTRDCGADAGAMISASHNPMEYNGVKLFAGDGYKLSDRLEDEIEALIREPGRLPPPAGGAEVGTMAPLTGGTERYIRCALSAADLRLDGVRIAVDCANGAAVTTAPDALRQLGAELILMGDRPNGRNINDGCGSTHPEALMALVRREGAALGLAFDGDGDRLLAVDETGTLVCGDQLLAICGLYLKRQGRLRGNTIAATVMSNLGLSLMGQREGIRILQTRVGDRYVLERMLEEGCCLGGEPSGHLIFLDLCTTGDGLITALQLLKVMQETGSPLSRLRQVMPLLPQVTRTVPVTEGRREACVRDEGVLQAVQALQRRLDGSGRVLVRPSGTEPAVRIMLEGPDPAFLEQQADALADLIRAAGNEQA